ncbi:MAG: ARMT1-like domain-containing protein [Desulfobulbaceae bacterium]
MRTESECLACFMRQAFTTAQRCTDDPSVLERAMRESARLIAQFDLESSPPENAVHLYALIARLTGEVDPFSAVKKQGNALALEMRGRMAELLESAADPLRTAVRLAIAGNIIDYGTLHDFDPAASLERCLETAPVIDDFPLLARELGEGDGKKKHVLLLADNCGEIVFDGLLAGELQRFGHDVTMAVRGGVILNDATLDDARDAGIDRICRVIDSGVTCPGTPLQDCSAELRDVFDRADIVLSKGQGNFETLSETGRPVYFFLTVKCPVVAAHIRGLRPEAAERVTGGGEPVLIRMESGTNAYATDQDPAGRPSPGR